ncbi:MAG: efflux RND transporter periplasmic adaptor subunit [Saprospiraceae bacterium]|nr:MAG: efflux RND transporter periplasmic adaptor subunit [Saprospiraceae bacterium]
MKRVIKYTLWVIVLGLLAFATSRQLSKNKEKIETNAKLSAQQNAVLPVVTGTAAKTTWQGSFSVSGNFAPFKQVPVMSEAAGKIVKLSLSNGASVNEGAVLAAIDNDLLNIELETTNINLAKAGNDLARLKKLMGEGGVTQQQIDDAQLGRDNLKAKVIALEKQISMSYVKAPVSGIITNKMVEKGSLVAPAMQLATITNIDRLRMQVYLNEEQVITVKEGQKIKLHVDLFPDDTFEGTITFIDVNAGPSRRYLVEVEIPNQNHRLKPGMTGKVLFEGGPSQEVLAVPRESIVGSLQDARIYVVENKKAVLRQVETGLVSGHNVQIRKGLKEGDSIVVSGQINLTDGMAISVSNK